MRRAPVRPSSDGRWLTLAGVGIVLATLFVFAPARHFAFVTYDDFDFVVDNPHVATGLTGANVRWAFVHAYDATGGPLTWISHMVDVTLFGLDAGSHHMMSVVLHVGNAILLMLVLWRMTSAPWASASVAALFALHPLHVESVAWVAERKDVLSTAFWLLATWSYVSYVRRPTRSGYATLTALFVCGLLAKPMVATWPFVLLLLDVWPLRRLSTDQQFFSSARRLALEKAPLFVLAAISMALAYGAQRQIGAVADFEAVPLSARLANAAVSYVAYLEATAWPTGLVPFYPYRDSVAPWMAWTCFGIVAILTAGSFLVIRRAPYVAVGWLWYIGTLVPVIGVVQVGGHAMADRFTYIPLVGLFIAIVWSGRVLLDRQPRLGAAIAVSVCILCALTARAQAMHWQNGVTLWEHAIRVGPPNSRAQANLGVAYAGRGDRSLAIAAYREALRLEPRMADVHNNLGLALAEQNQFPEARVHYEEAVRLKPAYANAHVNLANLLDDQGQSEAAIQHYAEAIRIDPEHILARVNLGMTLANAGRMDEARAQWETVLRISPTNDAARQLLRRN